MRGTASLSSSLAATVTSRSIVVQFRAVQTRPIRFFDRGDLERRLGYAGEIVDHDPFAEHRDRLFVGLTEAIKAFADLKLLLAGIGVGICSSVIPYVCDQLAMSRLPRASFALLLALLPAIAMIVGALVLSQIPSLRDLSGLVLVMAGVAVTPRRRLSHDRRDEWTM